MMTPLSILEDMDRNERTARARRRSWRWGEASGQLWMTAVFVGARAVLPDHYWTQLTRVDRWFLGAFALGCLAAWVWIHWKKKS